MKINDQSDVHPSVYIQKYLDESKIASSLFADELEISMDELQNLLEADTLLSPSLTIKLSEITGIPYEDWMKCQENYLEAVRKSAAEFEIHIYSACEIAEWFLGYAKRLSYNEDEEFLTNLKLQRLLYFAQGCCLAIFGHPLFDDQIIKWRYGPVVARVYQKYHRYGNSPIIWIPMHASKIDEKTESFLKDVYSVYGQYSVWGLGKLMQSEQPFLETPLNQQIPLKSLREFFTKNHVEEYEEKN
jgi:uncharacterized phage-associated protein